MEARASNGVPPPAAPVPMRNPLVLADICNSVLVCTMQEATDSGSKDKMKNYVDGGEAILEAFRKLKID